MLGITESATAPFVLVLPWSSAGSTAEPSKRTAVAMRVQIFPGPHSTPMIGFSADPSNTCTMPRFGFPYHGDSRPVLVLSRSPWSTSLCAASSRTSRSVGSRLKAGWSLPPFAMSCAITS